MQYQQNLIYHSSHHHKTGSSSYIYILTSLPSMFTYTLLQNDNHHLAKTIIGAKKIHRSKEIGSATPNQYTNGQYTGAAKGCTIIHSIFIVIFVAWIGKTRCWLLLLVAFCYAHTPCTPFYILYQRLQETMSWDPTSSSVMRGKNVWKC